MISRNENVEIINSDPYYMVIGGKLFGLFPWGSKIKEIYSEETFEKCDYAFGHFELNGIEMTGGLSVGAKYDLDDFFHLSDNVFSGHYHKNKLYRSLHNKSAGLLMVGSPMQLNWGEFNQDKFIYVLNPQLNDIKEIKNIVNSRYEKIYYSLLTNNRYTENELKKLCKDNYIKLVIDAKYQLNQILSLTELLRKFNPVTIETEYLISITNDAISESADDIVKSGSKDNKEYLMEYLEISYDEISKIDASIDKTLLFQLANAYYEKSQLAEKEQD